MYEIFYIHSPSHPLDSVSILEDMLEGICQLEDVAKITVYRTDSVDTLPDGVKNFENEYSTPADCVNLHRIDPSMWTGKENNSTIWANDMVHLISSSNFQSTPNTKVLIQSTGNGWHSSLLFYMFEIIGGQIWSKSIDGPATRLDRKIVNNSISNLLAAIGHFLVNNPDKHPKARDLQGGKNSVGARGIENTLRNLPEFFNDHKNKLEERKRELEIRKNSHKDAKSIDKELIEINKALVETKIYSPTEIGEYNCMLHLSAYETSEDSSNQQRGLIVLLRSNYDLDEVINYLREHRTTYDKFTFISQGFGPQDESKDIDFFEKIAEHLGQQSVIINPNFTLPISTENNQESLVSSSTELIKILYRIGEENRGISWSIDFTKCLGVLRPAIIQYSFLSSIPMIYFTKVYPDNLTVYDSGLSQEMHALHLPLRSEIEAISKLLKTRKLEYKQFLNTIYEFERDDENVGTELSATVESDGVHYLYSFNHQRYSSGDPRRIIDKSDSAAKKAMDRRKNEALSDGMINFNLETKCVSLTPRGKVAASLIGVKLRDG